MTQDVKARTTGAQPGEPGEDHEREETPTPEDAPRRPLWLRAIRGSLAAVSFLALCLAILAALVLVVLPAATGSGTYTILTSSMSPHYPPGTLMVVKPETFDRLRPGDVITYQIESGRPEVVSHRIVSMAVGQDGETTLVTQGDNNSEPDAEPVREVQVRGKLFFAVPYVGHVASWLGHQERGVVGQALAVALIGYGVCAFVSAGVARRRKGRHAPGRTPAGEPGEEAGDESGR
jgi:signal peptidase I